MYITVAIANYVRPLMRMKSSDLLYTTPTVAHWCSERNGKLQFHIPGCILLLLLIKPGMNFYPKYDSSKVLDYVIPAEVQCGWNEGYSNVSNDVRYSSTLMQTKPHLPPPSRGVTFKRGSATDIGSVSDKLELLRSRNRHRSS